MTNFNRKKILLIKDEQRIISDLEVEIEDGVSSYKPDVKKIKALIVKLRKAKDMNEIYKLIIHAKQAENENEVDLWILKLIRN